MKEIVKVKCIKHQYPDRTEVSICGLEFVVKEGEKVALIGKNGSGKTTMLLHIIGLLKPIEGEIKVFGVDPYKHFNKIGKNIGVVMQDVEYQLIGPTVFDDIAFSLVNYGFKKEEIEKRVIKIMEELKISHIKNKIVHYLSGGEKKKVAIAGALILRPKLLILDEPMTQLDPESVDIVLQKLNEYNKKYNTTIVMASNNLEIVEKFAQKIFLLEKGEIIFEGSFKNLKNHLYCHKS